MEAEVTAWKVLAEKMRVLAPVVPLISSAEKVATATAVGRRGGSCR